MSYQGHHSDGSSVQKHSAGADYPFVVYARGNVPHWEVIGPGIDGFLRFPTRKQATDCVDRLLAVRENSDAWAFEVEQLMTIAGVSLPNMAHGRVGALLAAGYPIAWADMSRVQRVASPLELSR